jgi:phosphopantothenoylcysteine decarboxylase / phosphopantothenate---cysteine ligase
MGFALARAAREAGAQVTLVAGPVDLPTPRGVQRMDVQTAQQMCDAVLPLAPQHSVFIATAAVADWRPSSVSAQKIKKGQGGPSLLWTENPDILAQVAALSSPPYCVGFAAETENLVPYASAKRLRKGVPLMVANLGPATFGRDDNSVILIDDTGPQPLPSADKLSLARTLVQQIAQRISQNISP